MNLSISQKATMTSIEIAELVGKRHDNVKRTIEVLTKGGVIQFPQIEEIENKQSVGPRRFSKAYIFEGEQGKRDSIIVVAQLSPEFTARLVDRWRELENARGPLKSKAEILAEMAQMHLEHERRINAVNAQVAEVSAQVSKVAETVEQIKKGNIPEGYISYRQLAAKCGLTEAKCRNLVNAYRIPTDTHEFLTPDGLLARRSIVALAPSGKPLSRLCRRQNHVTNAGIIPGWGYFRPFTILCLKVQRQTCRCIPPERRLKQGMQPYAVEHPGLKVSGYGPKEAHGKTGAPFATAKSVRLIYSQKM